MRLFCSMTAVLTSVDAWSVVMGFAGNSALDQPRSRSSSVRASIMSAAC